MPFIKLDWTGASQNTYPIAGYEITYKLSTDSTYSLLTNVNSTATSGTYTWIGAVWSKIYNFRIRTKDTSGAYSSYKDLTVNTVPAVNLPPTPFNSSSPTTSSTQIEFFFSGATDDYGIAGHEISYKKSTDSTYTTLPFFITSNGYLGYTLTGLDTNTEYNVRARTQDIFGVWSSTYYQLLTSTNPAFQYHRSNDSQTDFDLDVCAVNQPSVHCYLDKIIEAISVGDTVYTNNNLTSVFDGDGHWWRIGSLVTPNPKSYKINDLGAIEGINECPNYVQTFNYSSTGLTPPTLPDNETSDGCVALTLSNSHTLYSNKALNTLENGDRLYSNFALTTGFNGGEKIWLIGTNSIGTVSAKITTGGYIIEIYTCP